MQYSRIRLVRDFLIKYNVNFKREVIDLRYFKQFLTVLEVLPQVF